MSLVFCSVYKYKSLQRAIMLICHFKKTPMGREGLRPERGTPRLGSASTALKTRSTSNSRTRHLITIYIYIFFFRKCFKSEQIIKSMWKVQTAVGRGGWGGNANHYLPLGAFCPFFRLLVYSLLTLVHAARQRNVSAVWHAGSRARPTAGRTGPSTGAHRFDMYTMALFLTSQLNSAVTTTTTTTQPWTPLLTALSLKIYIYILKCRTFPLSLIHCWWDKGR